MKLLGKVEAYILNYNGKNTVLSTIDSLLKSEAVQISINIIDDHSSDNSVELIRQNYPDIKIDILPFNVRRINILRNKALESAKNEFVLITDNDLLFDKMCLFELLKVMISDQEIVTCTPRLMYWNQPEKIYTTATRVHFIGASISDQRDKIYTDKNNEISINSGGGICLIRKDVALKIGGYDQNFMMGWGNDGEFYQRLLRGGYKCYYVPSAFALHEDKLIVTNRKFRVVGQTYNRWVFILSHYSLPLLVLLTPAFFLYEIMQILFVMIKGILLQYIKGNFLVFKNLKYILNKRKIVQKLRVVSDKAVLFAGDIYVAPALIEKHKLIKFSVKAFSGVLNLYWRLIKVVIP